MSDTIKRRRRHTTPHAPPGANLRLYRWRCDQGHTWLSTADAEYCPTCDNKTITRERLSDADLHRLFPPDANGARKTNQKQESTR